MRVGNLGGGVHRMISYPIYQPSYIRRRWCAGFRERLAWGVQLNRDFLTYLEDQLAQISVLRTIADRCLVYDAWK